MALRQNISTNPFDELDDELSCGVNIPTVSTHRETEYSPTLPYPFRRVIIVVSCTVLVFILLVAGTATTAIAFPPNRSTNNNTQTPFEGESKLLGPLLLTSGCFLLCVDISLCYVMIRDTYHASKKGSNLTFSAWNRNAVRPVPFSFVGGPFFIATSDPSMASPPFLPMNYHRPSWVHPNAPLEPQTPDDEFIKRPVIRPETATLSRAHQPPYNPDVTNSVRGA